MPGPLRPAVSSGSRGAYDGGVSVAFRSAAALAAASALAAIAACGGEDHFAPLVVRARSGAAVDLSGTAWEACRPERGSPGVSVRVREEHGGGGGIVYTVTRYDGTDCSGDVLSAASVGSRASTRGEGSVAFTGTPPAGLGASVVATRLEVDFGAYGLGRDAYWVDDTVAPRVLYTGDPNAPVDADGYPGAFLEGGEVELSQVR